MGYVLVQMTASDTQMFLDMVQEALQQVRDATGYCEDLNGIQDLDGILVRLDSIFQCLTWVEPVFAPSVDMQLLQLVVCCF